MSGAPVLTILIALPLAGAAVVALLPREREDLIRWTGLAAGLAAFAVAARVFAAFDPAAGVQFQERARWVPQLGISYHLGVDGISLLLVGLTAFIFPLALLSSWGSIGRRVRGFTATMLLLEAAILGTFLSLDLILFYVFWEGMLIPMYFLIGIWGGERRRYAAIKFFLYTMAGSVLMLLAIIALYFQAGGTTFDVLALYGTEVPLDLQRWLFPAFALAFAIKVPLWPLHTWLPDAHVEAPTAGSVILAALLLKMGTYGFLRYAMPLFPGAAAAFAPGIAVLAIIGILYGGMVAFAQHDVKRLVAYSSVSHLGFVMLGLFAFNLQGVQGALLQMVNHGLSTGALFLLVGMLYDRTHTRDLDRYGGYAAFMPAMAAAFLVIALSSMALPATNGFVGEFLILLGTFRANPAWAAFAAGGVILSAVYLLLAYGRIMHGPPGEARYPDLGRAEALVLVPVVVLIFWIGLYPRTFLDKTEPAVRATIERIEQARDQRAGTRDSGLGTREGTSSRESFLISGPGPQVSELLVPGPWSLIPVLDLWSRVPVHRVPSPESRVPGTSP